MGVIQALALGIALVFGLPSVGHAQDAQDAQDAEGDAARARALFEAASAAMAEGRVADARDLFRGSLELEPRPATAFNLAVTLRESGAFLEALATYEAVLGGEYGELGEAQQHEIRSTIADVRRQLGRLVISVDGTDEVLLRVDGRALETVNAGARVEVPVDPGHHVVTARAPRSEPVEVQVILAQGETRRVPFALEPPAATPVETPTPAQDAPADDQAAFFAGPWPWVILGLLAAGGIAAAIAISVGNGGSEPAPLPDDLVFGRVMTLSF